MIVQSGYTNPLVHAVDYSQFQARFRPLVSVLAFDIWQVCCQNLLYRNRVNGAGYLISRIGGTVAPLSILLSSDGTRCNFELIQYPKTDQTRGYAYAGFSSDMSAFWECRPSSFCRDSFSNAADAILNNRELKVHPKPDISTIVKMLTYTRKINCRFHPHCCGLQVPRCCGGS